MNEISKEKTMTVKEVATALNVNERTVRRYAEKSGLTENGKTTFLNESQVTSIKLSIERSGRNDLDNVVQLPRTDLEMLMYDKLVNEWKDRKIKELKEQNEEMKPKALFYDQVTESKDVVDMASAAKVLNLGIGRNVLFHFLRKKKVLDDNNIPYQHYIKAGYFRVVENSFKMPNGNIRISLKTVVYQSGLDFILKIYDSEEKN